MFDWFKEKTQDESKTRQQKERARQKAVREGLSDKPVPGGPTAKAGKKVNKGMSRVERMMAEDRRGRRNR